MHPTRFSELNDVLRELVTDQQSILKDNYIGTYLQGSFAAGGADEHSDCDWIVAIHRQLSDTDLQELQAMHLRIFHSGPEWAKHLEGSYFPEGILRDYRLSGSDLWYLDNGSDQLEREPHCNKTVVRWILRERGIVLAGPEPATLIDPIPADVLRQAILASIRKSGERVVTDNKTNFYNRFYQCFIVLHFCRKLHNLHTGEVGSKREGAEWAKRHLDESWTDLIDRAWDGRPNPSVSVHTPPDPADYERTTELVELIMKLADEYAADSGLEE